MSICVRCIHKPHIVDIITQIPTQHNAIIRPFINRLCVNVVLIECLSCKVFIFHKIYTCI